MNGICKICGKPTKFITKPYWHYRKGCSQKCANKITWENDNYHNNMSGYKRTKEQKENIANSVKKLWDEGYYDNINFKHPITAETKEKISKRSKENWLNPLYRKIQTENTKTRWLNKEYKEKVIKSIRNTKNSKEYLAKSNLKSKNNILLKYLDKFKNICNIEFTNNLKLFNCKCLKCGYEFTFGIQGIKTYALSNTPDKLCPNCNPRIHQFSLSEKELSNYIKSFNFTTIENDKEILHRI